MRPLTLTATTVLPSHTTDQRTPCIVVRDLRQPLVAAAIHAGHAVRAEIAGRLALDEEQRLREEDPFTDRWTAVAPSRLIGTVSRFEVDLNRPRDQAVYRTPDDAWGLEVWRAPLPENAVECSLERYDAFYAAAGALLDAVHERFGRFAVLDLHSYNHRRAGPQGAPASAGENPEINLGTSTMDARFAPAVERFADALRTAGAADVRANVKFRGGHFVRWIHDRYPGDVCAIAIEAKKTFMDEWTGAPDDESIHRVGRQLAAAVPALLEAVGGSAA
jgi:N-formylglutamate amidohydrolase